VVPLIGESVFGVDRSMPILEVTPWLVGSPVPSSVRQSLDVSGWPVVLSVDRRDGVNASLRAGLFAAFSGSEVHRYSSFCSAADAERFLLGRGLLRTVLGSLVGMRPGDVEIYLGSHGKPFCEAGPQFSVSHSGDLVLIALHLNCPVGVDLERNDPCLEWELLASRVFSPDQVLSILELPQSLQSQSFLQAWCHLEARLKMAGIGFGVPMGPRRQWPLVRQWVLDLPQGYVGSLALGPALQAPLRDCADGAFP
jgi:4'-phosphopantetheinyl transferase